MIIDSHQHFWHYQPARDAWITGDMSVIRRDFLPEDLTPELDRNGVTASVAVQASQSEEETQFLLDLARDKDRICGVVGWLDLQSERVTERLQAWRGHEKLRGFRHVAQAEPDDRFLVRDEFVRGVRALAEFGFTYDILIFPRQLPAAIGLVKRCPGQRFVLDHVAKPPIKMGDIESWARDIRALASAGDVYCKLSGMVTEHDWRSWQQRDFDRYLDVVFEAFGPHRLMFGSDWPVCLVAASYAQVKQIVVDYTQRNAPDFLGSIMGGNAAQFYGVKISHGFAAQK